jgi:hypothetical protein
LRPSVDFFFKPYTHPEEEDDNKKFKGVSSKKYFIKYTEDKDHWRDISGFIVCNRSSIYLNSIIDKVREFKPEPDLKAAQTRHESEAKDKTLKPKEQSVKDLLSKPFGKKNVKGTNESPRKV